MLRTIFIGTFLLPSSLAWTQLATIEDPSIRPYMDALGILDIHRYLADTSQYTHQKTDYHLQHLEAVCQNRDQVLRLVQEWKPQTLDASDVKDVLEVECYELKKRLAAAKELTRFSISLPWAVLTHPVKGADGWEAYQRELKKLYSLEYLTDPDLLKIKKQLLEDWQRCGESRERFAELYAGDATRKAIAVKFLGYLAEGYQKLSKPLRTDTIRIQIQAEVQRYSERDWRLLRASATCSSGLIPFRSTLYCPSPTDHCNTLLLDFQDDSNAFQHLLCLTLSPDQPTFIRSACYLHAFTDFYVNKGATIVRMPREPESDAWIQALQNALAQQIALKKITKQ